MIRTKSWGIAASPSTLGTSAMASCSACHTAHGMGGVSGTISGERLVNFDVNIVASNGAVIFQDLSTT
jgi:hypothetical protein